MLISTYVRQLIQSRWLQWCDAFHSLRDAVTIMTDLSIFERRFLSAAACACLRWCVASTCATSCLHYYMILLINSRLKAVNCKANKAPSVGVTLTTLCSKPNDRVPIHISFVSSSQRRRLFCVGSLNWRLTMHASGCCAAVCGRPCFQFVSRRSGSIALPRHLNNVAPHSIRRSPARSETYAL